MYRFLDEDNIKKMSVVPKQQSKQSPLPPPPPPELIQQTINTSKIVQSEVKAKEVSMPVVLDKTEEYKKEVEKINSEVDFEYPKRGVSIQMTEKHDKKNEDKPIYQVSRNAGKVEIQTEAFKTQTIGKVDIVDRKDILQMMINKSRNELLEQQIELEVLSQMRIKVEENRKKAFEAKMKAQTEKVKELGLRISILEQIINNER